MNLVGRLFSSSIGRKILMAVTGLILIAFVIGHLVGNLQVFQDPDHVNGYAAFLHHWGPTLWAARIMLLAAVAVHIWAATVLTLENHAARDVKYSVRHTIRATLASRLMRWTGVVVLAFVLYHLAHFTFGFAQPATFKENLGAYTMANDYRVGGFPVVAKGESVPDVHSMMILGFQNRVVSAFYIVAIGMLSVHLLHGFDSMFQSVGWRSGRWSRALRLVAILFCAAYFLGNVAIPGAVLTGRLQVHAPSVATAQR
ncbi:MAG: succinate dehydrogenase (or fumarate reductase) cytochrome b subunit, b558 family [Verrucomicrobia bacterium]|nr:succinate dehydrogenase (or fumarate reductase) cytochrome b subunit, b558 family [Verrucomicrobiota bacterium]